MAVFLFPFLFNNTLPQLVWTAWSLSIFKCCINNLWVAMNYEWKSQGSNRWPKYIQYPFNSILVNSIYWQLLWARHCCSEYKGKTHSLPLRSSESVFLWFVRESSIFIWDLFEEKLICIVITGSSVSQSDLVTHIYVYLYLYIFQFFSIIFSYKILDMNPGTTQ